MPLITSDAYALSIACHALALSKAGSTHHLCSIIMELTVFPHLPKPICINTAILIVQSSMADLAYGHLMSAAREEGGMVYWGRSDITTNRSLINCLFRLSHNFAKYQYRNTLRPAVMSNQLLLVIHSTQSNVVHPNCHRSRYNRHTPIFF